MSVEVNSKVTRQETPGVREREKEWQWAPGVRKRETTDGCYFAVVVDSLEREREREPLPR